MELKNLLLGVVEAVIWYFFLWFLLDTLKRDRNLWLAALILLVLGYLGFVTCPWIRETEAWRKM